MKFQLILLSLAILLALFILRADFLTDKEELLFLLPSFLATVYVLKNIVKKIRAFFDLRFLIWVNIGMLCLKILVYERRLVKLKYKRKIVENNLNTSTLVRKNVNKAIKDSLNVWDLKIIFYKKYISILELKINELEIYKQELSLLKDTVQAVKEESHKSKIKLFIYQNFNLLEHLANDRISKKVSPKIQDLIKNLDNQNRRKRIDERINKLIEMEKILIKKINPNYTEK